MTTTPDLSSFIKAYDVRGLVGTQLTEQVVEALGAGFVDEIGAESLEIAVGHDMRDSSPGFAAAFARGATARGASVIMLGLCSTDQTYFASGHYGVPAAMFTASHNPATYNGIKFCRAGAQGISLDTGLAGIRDRAQAYLASGITATDAPGTISHRDVLADYATYLRELVDLTSVRPLRVVVDAGNGMGGLTVPAVLGTAAGLPALPLDIVPLYFELDGTFPNHEANPLEPANLVDLQAAVLEHGADLGLAFDGDADRCFVIDELGQPVTPSAVAAIVALREITRVRAAGETGDIRVVHNLITSRVVPETIEAAGAIAVRTKVGHSLIKDVMHETGAIFGGEHSAHYYFRDFWGADNGMLAAMHLIAQFGEYDGPLSALAAEFTPYTASGEINSTVDDVPAAYTRIVEAFQGRGEVDELDGLTYAGTTDDGDWWWFSVRPSNTEPLLRLNAEGRTAQTMARIRDEVLALIRA
ncbi:MAG: phosphomannomutase/phosphoglucomutase [Microcella sp.]|uniref:phosphomannomutase/phosphoglucomutase n=1 Tax=Microcella sp. TaxID=1913979 RepID=UPI0024CD3F4F|nr:phosphomannomutase/phosphoglucomutase [Microcella sp.]UYN82547.1 MAG: phosphomannomutase/phosphoglucomutase [Microcella sp.]